MMRNVLAPLIVVVVFIAAQNIFINDDYIVNTFLELGVGE